MSSSGCRCSSPGEPERYFLQVRARPVWGRAYPESAGFGSSKGYLVAQGWGGMGWDGVGLGAPSQEAACPFP